MKATSWTPKSTTIKYQCNLRSNCLTTSKITTFNLSTSDFLRRIFLRILYYFYFFFLFCFSSLNKKKINVNTHLSSWGFLLLLLLLGSLITNSHTSWIFAFLFPSFFSISHMTHWYFYWNKHKGIEISSLERCLSSYLYW